jgi:hypothetical protein
MDGYGCVVGAFGPRTFYVIVVLWCLPAATPSLCPPLAISCGAQVTFRDLDQHYRVCPVRLAAQAAAGVAAAAADAAAAALSKADVAEDTVRRASQRPSSLVFGAVSLLRCSRLCVWLLT